MEWRYRMERFDSTYGFAWNFVLLIEFQLPACRKTQEHCREAVAAWCRERFGEPDCPGRWYEDDYFGVYFRDDEDAFQFRLRWC